MKKDDPLNLTSDQKKLNAKIACQRYREKQKSRGYVPVQTWVPKELRAEVRELIEKLVFEFEKIVKEEEERLDVKVDRGENHY